MDQSDVRLYIRIKAFCCASWGITPDAFDEKADAEKITAEDVIELLFLKSAEPFGANVLKFIYREKEQKKKQKLAEAIQLVAMIKAEKDPVKIQELQGKLAKVNQ